MADARGWFWVACALLASVVASEARADLPPPPGQTRVSYSFRVVGSVREVVLVAFPTYASGDTHVLELELDKDVTPIQGFTPGIYAISASELQTIKSSADDDAVRKVLEAKARVCVKKVPRVFTVPSSTKVTSLRDVFLVRAAPDGCQASLQKTLYRGANREEGEGALDASGRRVPPAPFGSDLPPVGDIGLTPASPAPAPSAPAPSAAGGRPSEGAPQARGGCAGCMTSPGTQSPFALAALLAGAVAAVRRRRAPSKTRAAARAHGGPGAGRRVASPRPAS